MQPFFRALIAATTVLCTGSSAYAQATTGSVAGRVQSSDGQPLPGVTATVTSPFLQGARTTVTSETGDYLIPLLPPGAHTLVFELDGFQGVKRTQQVAGAYNATVNVTLSPAGVREDVTVVGDAQPLVETAQVATNFKQSLMSMLPSNRTIDAVLLMAPALHATGPRGAYTINGSQSYENLYTLDGATINENLRGAPLNPYIEDALQEVTVASAGVSAEYGRFSGGIANAVTKSGGNAFSGSLRTSFANENWRGYTPFESQLPDAERRKAKADKIVPIYEATFGGPIAKDRLWFFSAVRNQQQQVTRTTVATLVPYVRTNDEKRYEGKLTYTPVPGHSVRGSYLYVDQVLKNNTGSNVMDLRSLTNQGQPQDLYSLHYAGVLRPNLFLETQYSARHLTFTGVGANTRDLINGTMILDVSRNARFWSPTFCSGSTCDGDEQRNNSNFVLKASSFVPTQSFGTHHVVFGYDYFNDNIWANTHPSGSDYRIRATSSFADAAGVIYPQFIPGSTATSTIIEYTPITMLSEGSNLRTHALFVNDTWRLGHRFTFGLGLRLDRNQATDGSGTNVGDNLDFSPRLSAVWDPTGDGRWSFSGSVARYVMALTSNLAGATTAAGNAANYRWFYQGPAINASTTGPLVNTAAALQQLFDWFNNNGGTGRPYLSATVPGFNMTMPEPLRSPFSVEYAGGVTRTLGRRASVRVDGVFRDYKNLYSQRTDLTTGKVADAAGTMFDRTFVENTSDLRRRYAGLISQASYSGGRLSLGGNYTLSRAYGNVETETVNGGPSGASIKHYPEYRRAEWNYPDGDLSIDQRHRARAWATYAIPTNPSAGSLVLGLLQQFGSGVPYGAVANINPSSFLTNPGYDLAPAQIEYFFTARDAYRTEATYRTDLSLNYSYGVSAASEVFFHGEVLNAFNQFQLCGCGDTIFNNGGATNLTTIGTTVVPRTPFNPYTTQPAENVNWAPNASFGRALNTFAFTTPRLFRFSVGIRF